MPLGKRSELGDARYAGVEVPFSHDIAGAMQVSRPASGRQMSCSDYHALKYTKNSNECHVGRKL